MEQRTNRAKRRLRDHPSDEDKDRYIEIWKKAVETQMHFNEMSVKSRQLGLTFVTASLGVAVVMIARGDDFALSVGTWSVHVGVLLMLAAFLALWGVRGLDLNVYHRMLRGAVTFGEDFERTYMKSIFRLDKGMTEAISHFSRHSDAKVEKGGAIYRYTGTCAVTAEHKIRRFYAVTGGALIASALALFVIGNLAQPPVPKAMLPEPKKVETIGGASVHGKATSSANQEAAGNAPTDASQSGSETH